MSTMNRLGNSRNPYQTAAKRVLTVCSAGLLRSPTAANVLHSTYGYNTRAAGASSEYALIPVDSVLLHWAEEVVFMSDENYQEVLENFERELAAIPRRIVLNVPDQYPWGDKELEDIILKQYADAATMEKAFEV